MLFVAYVGRNVFSRTTNCQLKHVKSVTEASSEWCMCPFACRPTTMAFKAYLNYDKKMFKKEVLVTFGNGTVALLSSLLCTVFCLESATSTFLIHTCNCVVHYDLTSTSLQLDLIRCFCILL